MDKLPLIYLIIGMIVTAFGLVLMPPDDAERAQSFGAFAVVLGIVSCVLLWPIMVISIIGAIVKAQGYK